MGTQKNRLNEHLKHMLKLMGKKIFRLKNVVNLNLCMAIFCHGFTVNSWLDIFINIHVPGSRDK